MHVPAKTENKMRESSWKSLSRDERGREQWSYLIRIYSSPKCKEVLVDKAFCEEVAKSFRTQNFLSKEMVEWGKWYRGLELIPANMETSNKNVKVKGHLNMTNHKPTAFRTWKRKNLKEHRKKKL